MDAFVSTVPGLVLAGVAPKVGSAVKTVGQGLPKNQYNAFLKQTKMQSGPNASRAYQLNKIRQFFNRLGNQSGGAESATNNTSTIVKKVKDDKEN